MRALTFDPATDTFSPRTLDVPRPGTGDVLLRVAACGLNPVDAKIRFWKSMVPDMPATWVPGLDVSGVVEEVGPGVDRWRPGDRVLCHGDMLRPHGGLAEFSIQSAGALIPHPALDSNLAAATPCAGWTAWRALVDRLNVPERSSILVAGASGGVGSFAVQLAAHFGVETIIGTCSPPNADFVRSLGATHVIDYRSESVPERVMEITDGRGVEVGLDAVGPDNDILVANSLAFEGEMVELVGTVRPREYRDAFMKGLGFHQLSLGAGHRNGGAALEALRRAGSAFSDLVAAGSVTVPRLESVDLASAADRLTGMLEQRTVGKIVVTLS